MTNFAKMKHLLTILLNLIFYRCWVTKHYPGDPFLSNPENIRAVNDYEFIEHQLKENGFLYFHNARFRKWLQPLWWLYTRLSTMEFEVSCHSGYFWFSWYMGEYMPANKHSFLGFFMPKRKLTKWEWFLVSYRWEQVKPGTKITKHL